MRWPMAAMVKTAPLATTCAASRSAPFSSKPPNRFVFSATRNSESNATEMNIEKSRTAQLHPALIAAVPTMVLAIAPLRVRARRRRATRLITIEMATPTATRIISRSGSGKFQSRQAPQGVVYCLKGIRATVSLRSPHTN